MFFFEGEEGNFTVTLTLPMIIQQFPLALTGNPLTLQHPYYTTGFGVCQEVSENFFRNAFESDGLASIIGAETNLISNTPRQTPVRGEFSFPS